MMNTTHSSRRLLVTGATGGIGRAICQVLLQQAQTAKQELHVALAASRPSAELAQLTAELNDAGARAIGLHADLGVAESCQQLVDDAHTFCGGLDGLVSNAGMTRPAPLARQTMEDWERVFAVNTRAAWVLACAAHAALAQSHGAIVAVASMSGTFPHPGYGAYSASKAALIMLCRQLAQEWSCEGIRVNTVSPGMIRTPLTEPVYQDSEVALRRQTMVPLQRIGTPDDVAQVVAYLLSPQSAYVTGQNLRVDGGLCDHLLATIPGRARS